MAKTGKKTYYWDTASFIVWLDGGKGHSPEVIAGLDEVAKDINENRANLCTSVITTTEVLQGKLSPEQSARLSNLFKRRNVTQINVDPRIAQRASEIRNYYNQRGIKISTPDSIHLATAIIYGVDEFNTLDGAGERQRPSDLLRLNGDVAGHPLLIRVPVVVQLSLLTQLTASTEVKNESEDNSREAKPAPAQIPGGVGRPAEGKTGKIGKHGSPAEGRGQKDTPPVN